MILEALEQRGEEAESRPSLVDYTPEVERLDKLLDLTQELIRATVASGGGKAPKFNPQPRPQTSFEQVQHGRRLDKHKALSARLLPQKQEGAE